MNMLIARENVEQHLAIMETTYAQVQKKFSAEERANMDGYIHALKIVLNYLISE